jgi:hypothetical protein
MDIKKPDVTKRKGEHEKASIKHQKFVRKVGRICAIKYKKKK